MAGARQVRRERRVQLIETLVGNRASSPVRAWIETAVITALLPAIGWLIDSRDPFFLHGFPWTLLAPVLLGLQNGFRYALVSSLVLIAGGLTLWRMGYTQIESFPVSYVLSVGLIGVVAGEYRDKWQHSLDATRRENRQRGDKLEQFTRAYHLLKRSHDELEQRIASSGTSLQTTLDRVRAELEHCPTRALTGAGDSILRLFSHFGQVQMASLHDVHWPDKRGKRPAVVAEPVAQLGVTPDVDLAHPMVLDALKTRKLTTIREDRVSGTGPSPLICIPLADSSARLWGVILVHQMPFLAMTDEHMMLLAALGGRMGDWLAEHAEPREEAL
ncbi:MAG: hypothetical protein MJE77_24340 [Proteobacteria bacterium]|nr:hypothetical protein [Pseudomonadota bacterium]